MSRGLAGEHEHSVAAIQARIAAPPRSIYVRDWVLGAIDGSVTTFAVVSGVIGADLSVAVILIMGSANILADGFSMAVSNYTAVRSERDHAEHLRVIEARHIDQFPDGEVAEVREIYRAKGFTGADLDRAVTIITAERERWIDTMLSEEYGVAPGVHSPLTAAVATFLAFLICGLVPLAPFALIALFADTGSAFLVSAAATAVLFFAIGSLRSRWSARPWWRSGLETLGLGAGAAALAFAAGIVLKGIL